MSEHESLQQEIPAFIAGRLDDETRARVQKHLDGCADCARLVQDWQTIARGMQQEGKLLLDRHPQALELMRYTRGEPVEEREALERHVKSCASCSLEVAIWQDLQDAPGAAPAIPRGRVYRFVSYAAAASLLLGALIGFGLRDPGETAAPWTGPVDLWSLDPALRGESDDLLTIAPAAGSPYVPLVVLPLLPDGVDPADRYGFEITDGSRSVWSQRLSVGEINRFLATSGVLTFMVPGEMLPPGTYAAVFAPVEDGSAPLLEIDFRVQRQSPAATNAPQ